MDEATIRRNAEVIYRTNDLDKAIFKIDSKENLYKISRYNLVGRFINWCKGLCHKESNRTRVTQAFNQTVKGMIDLCCPLTASQHNLKKNYVYLKNDPSIGYHYASVANKITQSKKYSNTAIKDNAYVINQFRIHANLGATIY